jgi:hypothetical protein
MTAQPLTIEKIKQTRELFDALKQGDRVEAEHFIGIGPRSWVTKTVGTVENTERGRHGLHFRRNFDDKVFSDFLLVRRDDGELTTVAIDEFTILRRL